MPDNPGAWLVTTARNRAIDRLRRERTLAAKTRRLEVPQAAEDTIDEPTFADQRPTSSLPAAIRPSPTGRRSP